MGDTDSSCNSRAMDYLSSSSQNRNHKHKFVIYNKVLRRLVDLNVPDSLVPGFDDDLWAHFCRLPNSYALEVNVERAQDVLMHRRLLQMAHYPSTRPAVEVQPVQVNIASGPNSQYYSFFATEQSVHPPPAFGLSPDLKLALEATQLFIQNQSNSRRNSRSPEFVNVDRPMHEITISTSDKPKLFNQLTSLLSEIGLNIQEAHAFSTIDGYSLDVFLVDGWELEGTEQLKLAITEKIARIENHPRLNGEKESRMFKLVQNHINMHNSGLCDTSDNDLSLLKIEKKIASGSIGDLYKGTLYNQDVAVKVLRNEYLNDSIHREFLQEVDIMRKVQHKNVLKFIGARTRPPSLCIVTEFMSGGSVYDVLKQNGVLPIESLISVAIDISNGMNYLHRNNIIHRDLKSANLLMDENGVVKVSDFGVARVQAHSGVMTSETGTYRWMAPEVIEHKPYDLKADVYSFGIVLWELLTGQVPYENLTPLQAAIGVVHKELRPMIPSNTDPMLVELIERCWQREPSLRPQFNEILEMLLPMSKRVMSVNNIMGKRKERFSRIAPTFMHATIK